MAHKLAQVVARIFVGIAFLSWGTASSAEFPKSITFENFGKQLTLVKQGRYYRATKTAHAENSSDVFILSNRLVVQTDKTVDKPALLQHHPQVVDVTLLYQGVSHDYYRIEVKDRPMLGEVLNTLKHTKGVGLVQPDVLQVKNSLNILTDLEKSERAKNALEKIRPKVTQKDRAQTEQRPDITLSSYFGMLPLSASWRGNQGQGIKIAIIDDGFDLDHPALLHLKPTFSYDISRRRLTSVPLTQHDSHGTKVAGIIFAADPQGPMVGIVSQAELIALRHTDTWTSNTILSFYLASLAEADIINCSWVSTKLMQPVAEVVADLALNGRGGKGTIVVFAAGNQGREILPNSTEAAISEAIVVAAHNENFELLSRSNYGSSVDVTVYGGRVITTFPKGKYGYFSDTSMAAAIVSGMAARILSVQPQMTREQVQRELVKLTQSTDGM